MPRHRKDTTSSDDSGSDSSSDSDHRRRSGRSRDKRYKSESSPEKRTQKRSTQSDSSRSPENRSHSRNKRSARHASSSSESSDDSPIKKTVQSKVQTARGSSKDKQRNTRDRERKDRERSESDVSPDKKRTRDASHSPSLRKRSHSPSSHKRSHSPSSRKRGKENSRDKGKRKVSQSPTRSQRSDDKKSSRGDRSLSSQRRRSRSADRKRGHSVEDKGWRSPEVRSATEQTSTVQRVLKPPGRGMPGYKSPNRPPLYESPPDHRSDERDRGNHSREYHDRGVPDRDREYQDRKYPDRGGYPPDRQSSPRRNLDRSPERRFPVRRSPPRRMMERPPDRRYVDPRLMTASGSPPRRIVEPSPERRGGYVRSPMRGRQVFDESSRLDYREREMYRRDERSRSVERSNDRRSYDQHNGSRTSDSRERFDRSRDRGSRDRGRSRSPEVRKRSESEDSGKNRKRMPEKSLSPEVKSSKKGSQKQSKKSRAKSASVEADEKTVPKKDTSKTKPSKKKDMKEKTEEKAEKGKKDKSKKKKREEKDDSLERSFERSKISLSLESLDNEELGFAESMTSAAKGKKTGSKRQRSSPESSVSPDRKKKTKTQVQSDSTEITKKKKGKSGVEKLSKTLKSSNSSSKKNKKSISPAPNFDKTLSPSPSPKKSSLAKKSKRGTVSRSPSPLERSYGDHDRSRSSERSVGRNHDLAKFESEPESGEITDSEEETRDVKPAVLTVKSSINKPVDDDSQTMDDGEYWKNKQKSSNQGDKGRDEKKNGEGSKADKDRTGSKRKAPEPVKEEPVTPAEPAPKKPRVPDGGIAALTGKTGGAYIPPARLRAMQANITDKTSVEYQRISWEALKKSINGLVNKVNVSNIEYIVRELFQENIVRGRGLMTRSIIQAQAASPTFTHVYAALVAVVNTKFPQNGELVLRRLITQFKRGFKRNQKDICISSTNFVAHLVNQQVAHEVLALEILTLLLETPTDDSVEVAIGFLKEVGQKLTDVSPRGINAIFERLRNILHEGEIDTRVQYMVEVMFAVRKDHFKDYQSVREELDLVEEEDQFTHLLTLEDSGNTEDLLNVFKPDPEFVESEEKYKILKKEILDEESGDEEGGSDAGSDADTEDDSDEEQTEEQKQTIIDQTETNMVALRRTIYLTIQSSLDFEECAHKLMKMDLKPGQEIELCNMILDCCAQMRTYEKFFGLLAGRFCMIDKKYVMPFQRMFGEQYETIHRLETNKLRNIAKYFAHLLHTDSISWAVLTCIKLNEDDTTSASRIFIKILFQELSEYLGLPKLNERLKDPSLQEYFSGLLPRDNPRDTRFAINFFTTIGLGGLTDDLRDHLKDVSKKLMQQKQEAQAAGSDDDSSDSSDSESAPSSDSDSSDSDSSDSDSSDDGRKKKKKTNKKQKEKEKQKKKSKKLSEKEKKAGNKGKNTKDKSNGAIDKNDKKKDKKGDKKKNKAEDKEAEIAKRLAKLANYGDAALVEVVSKSDKRAKSAEKDKTKKDKKKKNKDNSEKVSKSKDGRRSNKQMPEDVQRPRRDSLEARDRNIHSRDREQFDSRNLDRSYESSFDSRDGRLDRRDGRKGRDYVNEEDDRDHPIRVERNFERMDIYEDRFTREREKNLDFVRGQEEYGDYYRGRGDMPRGGYDDLPPPPREDMRMRGRVDMGPVGYEGRYGGPREMDRGFEEGRSRRGRGRSEDRGMPVRDDRRRRR